MWQRRSNQPGIKGGLLAMGFTPTLLPSPIIPSTHTLLPRFLPPESARCDGDGDDGSGGHDEECALPAQLGSFAVGKVLCKGALGVRVAVAHNKTSGEKVCLKFIPKASLGDMDVVLRLDAMVQSLTLLAGVAGIVRFQQRQDTSTHVVLVFDHWVNFVCLPCCSSHFIRPLRSHAYTPSLFFHDLGW